MKAIADEAWPATNAVAALLTHRNQEEAARAVGIGVATLLRWQKDPELMLLTARRAGLLFGSR
jgi:hypothetical protein